MKVSSCFPDVLAQNRRKREMLEDRHDIGKSLVKSGDIAIRWFSEIAAETIDDGVRNLVRDDVLRQAGKNVLPRNIGTRIFSSALK